METFINTLNKNAFDNIDITGYNPDMHGWMDPDFKNIIYSILNKKDKSEQLTIIEVGSWKGLSCITIANTVKNMGFQKVNIIAIDTWLGAPEFWTWGLNDPTRGESLKLTNGYPAVFNTFTKNVKYYGHNDIITPFPISSIQAVDVLKYYNITADMIYIDAAHEYKPVKEDINAYWEILKNGGSMIGDDYMDGWPGVKQAVNEFGTPTVKGVVWNFNKV